MTFFRSKKKEASATSSEKRTWYQTFSQRIRDKFIKSEINGKENFTKSYDLMCFDNYAYGDGKSYGF